MSEQNRPDTPALDRFDADVRRTSLLLLAAASDGEHADLTSGVDRFLERPDIRASLGFLARLSFAALTQGCGSSDAALSFIRDEIDVADFAITMPDTVDLEDPALTFPDIVGRA
ncbi:hypothetical protein ACNO8X_26080 [Mycobacterium sp. PDNC021]|uniref:hypothetical protein n=1 Tax=Mycobacterium sp. PDNC021 TaxID=3391399 RepID=UPI003AAA2172